MRVQDIEIPYAEDRDFKYKLFEKLPALITYFVLALPIILSLFNPVWAAYFIIFYIVLWFIKAVVMAVRSLQGYNRMQRARKLDWLSLLKDVDNPEEAVKKNFSAKWGRIHKTNLESYLKQDQKRLQSSEIIQAVIMAFSNEPYEILDLTVQSLIKNKWDSKKHTVRFIGYEERNGKATKENAERFVKRYKNKFLHIQAVGHPDKVPGEVSGKGSNMSHAAKFMDAWFRKKKIDAERVIVTTIDSDNRPDPAYFAALTYSYILAKDRLHKSFQPIPMFFTNMWHAPTMMRIIATGNSFWMVISSTRYTFKAVEAAEKLNIKLVKTDDIRKEDNGSKRKDN